MIVDLGTGDGHGALALAVADPGAFVLGVDPVAGAMAETSRRAARVAPNVVFLAGSAEVAAAELPGCADLVVVSFPWGSLLRGILGADAAVGAALAAIPRPGGVVRATVSVTARDGVPGLATLDEAAAHRMRPSPALEPVAARPVGPDEVRATGSTWGRRLLAGGGHGRPVWRLEWRRLP